MSFGQYLGAGSAVTKGLWHLNGNANDASGNANNGTGMDITYSLPNGKFGQGAGFNGTSSKIAFSNKIIPVGAKTIIFWIYKTAVPTVVQCILDQTATSFINTGITTYVRITTGKIQFDLCKGNAAAANFRLQSTMGVCDSKWYCVAMAWDGSTNANMANLFINGNIDAAATATATDSAATNNLAIGVNSTTGNTLYLSKNLAEIIIENRAWSATEIQKYYTYSLGRF